MTGKIKMAGDERVKPSKEETWTSQTNGTSDTDSMLKKKKKGRVGGMGGGRADRKPFVSTFSPNNTV